MPNRTALFLLIVAIGLGAVAGAVWLSGLEVTDPEQKADAGDDTPSGDSGPAEGDQRSSAEPGERGRRAAEQGEDGRDSANAQDNDANQWLQRAMALFQAGRTREATELLETVRRRSAGSAITLSNVGAAYRNAGLIDESISTFQQAIEVDDSLPFPRVQLGLAYLAKSAKADDAATKQAFMSQAADAVDGAIELDDSIPLAHSVRGAIYRASGELGRAIEHYRAAEAAEPTGFRWPLELAVTLYQAEQYDAAIDALDRAIALDNSQSEVFRMKATVLKEAGRFDEALEALAEARRLAPDNPELDETERLIQGAQQQSANETDDASADELDDAGGESGDVNEGEEG